MKYCNNCGSQMEDEARFCPKCGTAAMPIEASASTSNESAPTTDNASPVPQEKKKIAYFDIIKRYFWQMFISFGLSAVLLIDLGFKFVWSGGKGFMICCGVFAILAACVFLTYAILDKIIASKESGEDKQKHMQRSTVCLIIGIIVFVYVLVAAIAMFSIKFL